MPSLEFFVVAESAAVDQDTNRTSVFDILEEQAAAAFPSAIPHAVAVVLWLTGPEDENQDWQSQLRVTLPGDAQHYDFATNFTVQPGVRRQRIVQRMVGIPLRMAGEVVFELSLNGNHVASHVTTVRELTETERARMQRVNDPGP